jgi:alpha/beta superfamily hydrolase
MSMPDQAILFGADRSIAGIFTPAEEGVGESPDTAVICITAGMLHHVGPHRMHVLLARALGKHGIASLRFDISGIGDSAVRTDDLPAQEVPVDEVNQAIVELEGRGFSQFILFGICSGAVHATKVAAQNSRVLGAVLLNTGTDDGKPKSNPQIASQYYLKRSIWSLAAWKHLFTGKVKYRALVGNLWLALLQKLTGKNKTTDSMSQEAQAGIQHFIDLGTSVLMVYSDRNAQVFELYKEVFQGLECANFKTLVYPDTDHLFTSLAVQRDLIDQVCQWSTEVVARNA